LNIGFFYSDIKNIRFPNDEREIIKTFGIDSSFSIPNSSMTIISEINYTKHSKISNFNQTILEKGNLNAFLMLSIKF
jgi:hypothetical protein